MSLHASGAYGARFSPRAWAGAGGTRATRSSARARVWKADRSIIRRGGRKKAGGQGARRWIWWGAKAAAGPPYSFSLRFSRKGGRKHTPGREIAPYSSRLAEESYREMALLRAEGGGQWICGEYVLHGSHQMKQTCPSIFVSILSRNYLTLFASTVHRVILNHNSSKDTPEVTSQWPQVCSTFQLSFIHLKVCFFVQMRFVSNMFQPIRISWGKLVLRLSFLFSFRIKNIWPVHVIDVYPTSSSDTTEVASLSLWPQAF